MKQKIIVAVFKKFNPDTNKSTVAGYRFFDLQKKAIEDFSIKDKKFSSYLIKNKDNIENAIWDSSKMSGKASLKFINGRESRYPVLNADTGELMGVNPLVIAAEFKDGYLVVGPFGECFEWTKEQAVTYAKLNGIANGSYKTKNNNAFISAIDGNYAFIDRNIITPEMLAKKEALEKAKREKLEKQFKSEEKPVKKVEDLKQNLKKEEKKPLKEENESKIIDVEAPKVEDNSIKEENDSKVIDNETLKVEDKPVEQTILDEVKQEVMEEGLTSEEVEKALSEVKIDEDVSNRKYDDDFYKQLEPTFGGKKSVDVLKYMIEVRNYPIDMVYKLIEEGKEVNKYVPSLIGLITMFSDVDHDVHDEKLHKLCKIVIDPEVLKICQDLRYKGIDFTHVWDADIITPNRNHDTRKWAFPLSLLEERIANYIATYGCVLYSCAIDTDGSIYYNDVEVKVPGYRISGVNPSYITITNEDGKTKKVKNKK